MSEANIKVQEAVQVKQSPGIAEKEPNNTQENGPLQKEAKQTATPSPGKLKENPTRAQEEDVKEHPAELLQCTFNSLPKEQATADWEVFTPTNEAPEEETPASVQDKIPDSSSLTAAAVCPETQTETNPAGEHVTLDTTRDKDEAGCNVPGGDAVAEPSEVFSQNKGELPVPNPQLSAAAGQVSSIPAVGQEKDKESPNCAASDDSENRNSSVCEEVHPEVVNSRDVCESSPGPEPTGLDHSGEERDAAKCVSEPETTAPTDASESSKSDKDAQPELEGITTSSKEVTSSEIIKQDIGEEITLKGQDKDGNVPKTKEEDELKEEEAENAPGRDEEVQEESGKEEQPAGGTTTTTDVKADEMLEKEDAVEDGLQNSEEDLYRGAEELSASQTNKPETTFLKVEDRCSLALAVDILSYSEREWKGNTAKSALIRKGYKEMSQSFGSVRRVRGDNYCALRATLFQVLSHSTQLPTWLQEEDINMLWKQLEAQEGLISEWIFPGECLQPDGTGDATLQLKGYTELLRNKWQAAVDCSSAAERQQLCERAFQGGEEELGLLEALKLLMLGRAVELHSCMQAGGDVPLFCWLLFARDSSDCPRSFLSNHLSHVGLSAGLEQVEMFLLGYALQCTIQVYRLYKADTEEFVTYYPDDHKDDWPSLCLVTEDDRHYNVPVVEAAEELHKQLSSS
ncbi:uncharacterized protein LOC131962167 isoform X2 [Centropristis striata]|nr:uncharacterized protein LOC131962167 isoform X2 [Centropristis striata]